MFSGLDVVFQGTNFVRLLQGLWAGVEIAFIAMAISLVSGTVLGVVMLSRHRLVVGCSRAFVHVVRFVPQLVLLFVVFFELTRGFGLTIEAKWAAVLVFSLWGTAEMGDLVRGAISAVPQHQWLSAQALGFSGWRLYRFVVIPQALRALVPVTINLLHRMIMTTSLVVLIGVVEVLKVAQQIIDVNRFEYPSAALWVYAVVAVLYFSVCFPISLVSRVLERKWSVA